jgi:hypothetical protein
MPDKTIKLPLNVDMYNRYCYGISCIFKKYPPKSEISTLLRMRDRNSRKNSLQESHYGHVNIATAKKIPFIIIIFRVFDHFWSYPLVLFSAVP